MPTLPQGGESVVLRPAVPNDGIELLGGEAAPVRREVAGAHGAPGPLEDLVPQPEVVVRAAEKLKANATVETLFNEGHRQSCNLLTV